MVQQNQQEFLRIMQTPSTGAPQQSALPPPGAIQLTDADREAVQNLVQIGAGLWDEQAAAIAYVATGKNVETAAALLFEYGGLPPGFQGGGGEGNDEGGQDEGEQQ